MKKVLTILFCLVLCVVCIGMTSCDDTEPQIATAHQHSWSEWVTVKDATCSDEGLQEKVCACGEKETQSIDKVAHTEVVDVAVASTCTETGLNEGKHCSVCDAVLVKQEEVKANGHAFDEWKQTLAPTCTEKGSERRDCENCEHFETKDIDALEHDHSTEWTVDVEPTCTEKGSKSHHCSRCPDKADVTEIPKNDHSFGEWTQTLAPTCTEKGSERRDCENCEHFETRDIDALEHDYSTEWTVDIEPTCTTIGSKSHHCSRCPDKADVTEIPKNDHSFGEWTQTLAPTCTEKGSERKDCKNCEHFEAREIKENGHTNTTPVIENLITPTCTKGGSYDAVVYCSVCSDEVSRDANAIGELGHDHSDEWTVDVEPTCTEKGSKSHHCSRCLDKADVTEIPANDHSFDEWSQILAPTCTQKGSERKDCKNCDHYEIREVNANGHTNVHAIVENLVAPTCTKDGNYDSVVYCSVCSDEVSRTNLTLPANGHTNANPIIENRVEPTCTIDGGYDSVIYCSVCTDEVSRTNHILTANGHSYNSVVTPPTVTEQGYTTHTCSACGDTFVDSYVPAGSVGLSYTVNADGESCTITGLGTCTDTEVYIPSGIDGYKVTAIGDSAFYNCTVLTFIKIPDGVTSIGFSAFRNCTSLTSIIIPEGVTILSESMFEGCSSLASVTIPNSVTVIGESALEGCVSLTTVTIPDKVTTIGIYAFYRSTGLTNIILGKGVNSIGEKAFTYCTNLSAVYYTGTASDWAKISIDSSDNSAIAFATVYYYSETQPAVGNFWHYVDEVPCPWHVHTASDWIIDTAATCTATGTKHKECTGCLTLLETGTINKIPHTYDQSKVASTYKKSDATCTSGAIYYHSCKCGAKGTTTFTSGNPIPHDHQATTVVPPTKFEPGYTVYTCTCGDNFKVDIPAGSVGLSYSVNTDGKTCTITGIGTCKDTEIVIPSSIDGYTVTSISDSAFRGRNRIVNITISNSVTSIGSFAFFHCTALTSIKLPDGLTSLSESMFEGCSSLASITIPNSVTQIGESALEGCASLTTVTIPDNVTTIGIYAFYRCTGLRSLTIPNSVTSIGYYSFVECSSLTNLTIGNSVTSICEDVFYRCYSITSITLTFVDQTTDGNQNISIRSLFSHLSLGDGEIIYPIPNSLKTIVITGGSSIGYGAFYGCSGLTSITIPDSITSIAEGAFSGCSNLTDVYYTGTADEWEKITIGSNNDSLTSATIYYYSSTQPTTEGNYWHYVDGVPTKW